MTIHDPVEKNLKHKTDVLSWSDVPWEDCDLNFRPPSWSQLSLSVGAMYGQLLLATTISLAATAMVCRFLVPLIIGRSSWIEVLVVAAVVGMLAMHGWYRPLPRAVGRQDSTEGGLLVLLSIAGFYALVRLGYGSRAFDCGVIILFAVAIPSCLCVADQLTGHMLHWWSADPGVPRNTMVLWRNAWCGRFITAHVDELADRGVEQRDVAALKSYWLGHVAIVVVYAVATLASLLVAHALRLNELGIVFLATSTGLLLLTSAWADSRAKRSKQRTARVLGHWLLYLKDSASPAWVMQSPAGPQLRRAFQSYSSVAVLAISFWLLGLVAVATPSVPLGELRGTSVIYSCLVGCVSAVLAPLHWLLICFVVSAPTLSSIEAGLHAHREQRENR